MEELQSRLNRYKKAFRKQFQMLLNHLGYKETKYIAEGGFGFVTKA